MVSESPIMSQWAPSRAGVEGIFDGRAGCGLAAGLRRRTRAGAIADRARDRGIRTTSSPAATSPTCCWCARRGDAARTPCVWRSGRKPRSARPTRVRRERVAGTDRRHRGRTSRLRGDGRAGFHGARRQGPATSARSGSAARRSRLQPPCRCWRQCSSVYCPRWGRSRRKPWARCVTVAARLRSAATRASHAQRARDDASRARVRPRHRLRADGPQLRRVAVGRSGILRRGRTDVHGAAVAAEYADAEGVAQFYDRLIERLEAVPGVTRVGAINALPFHLPLMTWAP